MYVPLPFREERRAVLTDAIRDIQFAALVTPTPDGILASHLPMVVRQDTTGLALHSHVARPNEHWRAAGSRSLAIFQGPQTYVSPSWYESKRRHGKVVPTWAYIAVHAHGVLEAVEDDAWLSAHLDDLTQANERERPQPWAVTDAPADFIHTLSRAIVGLVLSVERLEGAWKLNQHRPEDDRLGAMAGLDAGQSSDGRAVAQAMRDLEAQREGAAHPPQ